MEATSNQVLEEAKKRFQQIMEYTTFRKNIVEAGEEDGQQQDGAEQDPNMGGADPNAMPPMDDQEGMPQEQGADMSDTQGQGGPQGFDPQIPEDGTQQDPNAMPPMDDQEGMPQDGGLQPDDEVVDISDLTDAQEDTEKDIEKLGDKFDKVMKYLGQFEELIKSNDEKINDLKSEIEKRNPTQIEKLSMQTARSYPFNVTPEDFWKEKEATTNYRTENDDNGKEQGQYVITKNDVDGTVDWKGIADTLDDYDIMHQTMKNTMGLGL